MITKPSASDERPLLSPGDIHSAAFQEALQAVPAGVMIVDSSGTMAFLNSAAERMFLYERREWQGEKIEALIPPAHRAGHPAHATVFFKAPTSRTMGAGRDMTALRRDGTEFPVEIGLSPLATSEGIWVIASLVDLSERKRLEMKVQEQHERFRASWDAASEGLVTVDESGRIEMVNQATERIFGYDRSELVGQPLETIVPETHRQSHAGKRERYFAEPRLRTMGTGLALSGRKKDGTLFPVEVGLNVARIGGRTVAIGFVTDITEKKRLEEQSLALGTLVDLQQKLATSSRRAAASRDSDPLTGLDTRAMFEQEFEKASSDPTGLSVIVYSIQYMDRMSARFGKTTADRIVVFASQYIANSLDREGDRLFRWDDTTLVGLVRRDATVAQLQRQVNEVCGKRLEYFVKHSGGSALVMIASRARILANSQTPVAQVVSEIEQIARS